MPVTDRHLVGLRRLLLLGLGLANLGCIRLNEDHCANRSGDRTCAEHSEATPYCDRCSAANDGCVAAVPPTLTCRVSELARGIGSESGSAHERPPWTRSPFPDASASTSAEGATSEGVVPPGSSGSGAVPPDAASGDTGPTPPGGTDSTGSSTRGTSTHGSTSPDDGSTSTNNSSTSTATSTGAPSTTSSGAPSTTSSSTSSGADDTPSQDEAGAGSTGDPTEGSSSTSGEASTSGEGAGEAGDDDVTTTTGADDDASDVGGETCRSLGELCSDGEQCCSGTCATLVLVGLVCI